MDQPRREGDPPTRLDLDGLNALKAEWDRQAARRTPMNIMYEVSDKDLRAYVDHPQRLPWMLARATGTLVVALVVLAVWDFQLLASHTLWSVLSGLAMGTLLMQSVYYTLRRAQGYRDGYLRGRRELIRDLYKAREDGVDIDTFTLDVFVADGEVLLRGN